LLPVHALNIPFLSRNINRHPPELRIRSKTKEACLQTGLSAAFSVPALPFLLNAFKKRHLKNLMPEKSVFGDFGNTAFFPK
jgi:hypothetical protein